MESASTENAKKAGPKETDHTMTTCVEEDTKDLEKMVIMKTVLEQNIQERRKKIWELGSLPPDALAQEFNRT